MAEVTTVGTMLINDALPPVLRKNQHRLDKKGVHKLLTEVASKHPDQYKQVLEALSDVGRTTVWTEGLSVSLASLRRSKAKEELLAPVRERIREIIEDDSLSDAERKDTIVQTLLPVAKPLQDAILEESREEKSPFALQVESGARGNPGSLASLRGADLLATDQSDQFIPLPLLRSYAEGFTPAEYFAASYGQRKGALDVKMAVADAGFLCLSGATQVRMADYSTRPISEVKVGDLVLGANVRGETFPVTVNAVFDHGLQPVVEYSFRSGRNRQLLKLVATPQHKMLALRKLGKSRQSVTEPTRIPLSQARRGYGVVSAEASPAVRDERHVFTFVSKRDLPPERVWDIEVDHPDHLFVLANGMVTSNSKQLVNAAHRQVVTHEEPVATRLPTGLPVSTSDRDNIGAVLALDQGQYPAGTVITDDILQDLEDETDEILVYSPMTDISEDGGISAKAAGRRTRQGLHVIGDNIGIPAAQAIGERLSQGALESKHSAGVNTKVSRSGFEYINRLIQAPETFPESGPLSEADGTVNKIEEASQGGHYVTVGDQQYYAAPDLEVTVRVGDQVEQGDDLTDGVPHPQQLVRLRGMGEARRVYADNLREALGNSGVKVQRRNLESVVTGILNWAQITTPDGIGDNIYGDIAPYNKLMASYKPRKTAQDLPVKKLRGKYLEEPVLHYTPGTRVTNEVIERLKRYGVKSVYAHDDEPDFEPYMVRGMHSVYHDPDWRTRQAGFYTSRAFQRSLHRGLESDTESTSFVPGLGQGKSLGTQLGVTGKYGQAQPR